MSVVAGMTSRSSSRGQSPIAREMLFPAVATTVAACVIGAIVPHVPPTLVIAGVLASLLVAAVALHPPIAAYTLLGATPLVAGIDRGSIIPVLRPSEGLALLVGAGLAVRGVARIAQHGIPKLTLRSADASIVLIAIASSIIPILWMLLRGVRIEPDDSSYALVIWKFYAIYLIVRCSIHTVRQTKRCLYIALSAAGIVAIIAALQALHLFGVPQFLQHYYAPYGNEAAVLNNRGGATLALPIAAGDLFVFSIAIAFALFVRGVTRAEGWFLLVVSTLCVGGVLAAGEFSAILALVIAGVALAWMTHRGRYIVRMLPVIVIASWLMRPVLEHRLSDIDGDRGIPVSWVGRLDNLQTFFWPRLFSHGNFILGIRPASRVATPKFATGWVWIESGYTWLLWAGGIPLLLAFLFFIREGIRTNMPRARYRNDAVGAAALAVVVSLIVIAALMTLDPHLTYRGSADLVFALLALAAVRVPATSAPPAELDPRQSAPRVGFPARNEAS
jgi:hypothetical protein